MGEERGVGGQRGVAQRNGVGLGRRHAALATAGSKRRGFEDRRHTASTHLCHSGRQCEAHSHADWRVRRLRVDLYCRDLQLARKNTREGSREVIPARDLFGLHVRKARRLDPACSGRGRQHLAAHVAQVPPQRRVPRRLACMRHGHVPRRLVCHRAVSW